MLRPSSSDFPDLKNPGRTPSTESEVQFGTSHRTTAISTGTFSEPIQWVADPSLDPETPVLEVRNFCWKSYVLLPKSPLRCLQFSLPLKSCRLGSVTERWWECWSIYPAIAAPRYELESFSAAPTTEVNTVISAAESLISSPISEVSLTQLRELQKAKIRYLFLSVLLLGVLLVLGLSGFLLDPQLTVVSAIGAVLLELWCFYWIAVRSADMRRSYKRMRHSLEWFCHRQPELVAKGYSIKVTGPFVLQVSLPQANM